jgi:sortase A
MKKYIRIFAFILLFVGIGVLLYPFIAEKIFDRNTEKLINHFDEQYNVGGKSEEFLYPELYKAMQEYNENLYKNGQENFKDAYSYQPASFELTKWGFQDNMVGYIEIPKMDIKLPIYLGASEENMKKGAVHLTETSLPIGGENTNCVIAAHRGYSGAPMFREIEKLEIGDEVYITNFWYKMTYKVVDIKIISPDDVEKVLIQSGRDLVTLSTCHPYRYNYQRYIVYCERGVTE